MAKEEKKERVKKDHGKANKRMGLPAAILIIIPCLTLATFAILDVCGVFPLLGATRSYTVSFYSDNELLDSFKLKRGDKLEYDYTPDKDGYRFMGWDIDNNKIPDILPQRIYYDIKANAVWSKAHEKSI